MGSKGRRARNWSSSTGRASRPEAPTGATARPRWTGPRGSRPAGPKAPKARTASTAPRAPRARTGPKERKAPPERMVPTAPTESPAGPPPRSCRTRRPARPRPLSRPRRSAKLSVPSGPSADLCYSRGLQGLSKRYRAHAGRDHHRAEQPRAPDRLVQDERTEQDRDHDARLAHGRHRGGGREPQGEE